MKGALQALLCARRERRPGMQLAIAWAGTLWGHRPGRKPPDRQFRKAAGQGWSKCQRTLEPPCFKARPNSSGIRRRAVPRFVKTPQRSVEDARDQAFLVPTRRRIRRGPAAIAGWVSGVPAPERFGAPLPRFIRGSRNGRKVVKARAENPAARTGRCVWKEQTLPRTRSSCAGLTRASIVFVRWIAGSRRCAPARQ